MNTGSTVLVFSVVLISKGATDHQSLYYCCRCLFVIFSSSKNGMAAIHVAALFGQTDVVQEFLSRAPKSAYLVSEVRNDLRTYVLMHEPECKRLCACAIMACAVIPSCRFEI